MRQAVSAIGTCILQSYGDTFFQDPDDPGGRWLLRITDQGVHPLKGRGSFKTTKTESRRRTFPIHPELLRLNFLAFVDHGEFEVVLRTGARLAMSRTYRGIVETVLGQPI